MKLIIDIPYDVVIHEKYYNYLGIMNTKLADALENAIPLDSVIEDIKAEIREMPTLYSHTCDVIDREGLLDLIDMHIGGKDKE